ncbi:hypothetical protein BS78_05G192000 [Paspalum vaginatum]|nr:hypothetical protein BS78_05G192000 [Paspalum vaginatum]
MSKEFEELALDGSNYPAWATDIKIAFASRGILSIINEPVENGPVINDQMKYMALLLLKSSIHPDLQKEYLLEKNHRTLWVSIKELHNICTKLRFCEKEPTDAEKIFKTLLTMHPADRLIHSLTQAERNDELLLKNHHLRPVSLAPLLEVDNVQNKTENTRKFTGPSSGNGTKNSNGRRRRRNNNKTRGYKANKKARGNAQAPHDKRFCHKCGCNTHFAATCRTPKHLVGLYLKSTRDAKQQKGTRYEAHFNQTEENNEAGSFSVPPESPNKDALAQNLNPSDANDMMVEYNSNDMFGDFS